jgi:hypothetical protein
MPSYAQVKKAIPLTLILSPKGRGNRIPSCFGKMLAVVTDGAFVTKKNRIIIYEQK